MSEITKIRFYDNRENKDIVNSTPTSIELKEVEIQTFTKPIKTYYVLVELKEGFTLRMDMTKELYDTLHRTMKGEGENE